MPLCLPLLGLARVQAQRVVLECHAITSRGGPVGNVPATAQYRAATAANGKRCMLFISDAFLDGYQLLLIINLIVMIILLNDNHSLE